MSYALSDTPAHCAGARLAPGCPVGPYVIDDGQIPLHRRVMMSWGAWPDLEHPEVLYTNQGRGVTMSTNQALVSLKYQVAAAGVGALVVGGLIGYFTGGRKK